MGCRNFCMAQRRLTSKDVLGQPIEHVDITAFDSRPLIDQYRRARGSAGDIAAAADTYNKMLTDPGCTIILTLAGSSSAQGLMHVWPILVRNNIVDAVITTGASAIDMDLFEALGFRHYRGTGIPVSDNQLGKLGIDRIYDTFIQEDELQQVDAFCKRFLDSLPSGTYAPWQLLSKLGERLSEKESAAKKEGSLLQRCYEHNVPLFSIGLTDSAFGMGSPYHQIERHLQAGAQDRLQVTVDTTPEYTDLAKIKLASPATGLFMIGGGLPKNHAQDTVIVAQGILAELRKSRSNFSLLDRMGYGLHGHKDEVPLHKYAIQITVADPRDGACSSSTLSEARSWGKVSLEDQVMVFGEATGITPLILSAVYHEGLWRDRSPREHLTSLDSLRGPADFIPLSR